MMKNRHLTSLSLILAVSHANHGYWPGESAPAVPLGHAGTSPAAQQPPEAAPALPAAPESTPDPTGPLTAFGEAAAGHEGETYGLLSLPLPGQMWHDFQEHLDDVLQSLEVSFGSAAGTAKLAAAETACVEWLAARVLNAADHVPFLAVFLAVPGSRAAVLTAERAVLRPLIHAAISRALAVLAARGAVSLRGGA